MYLCFLCKLDFMIITFLWILIPNLIIYQIGNIQHGNPEIVVSSRRMCETGLILCKEHKIQKIAVVDRKDKRKWRISGRRRGIVFSESNQTRLAFIPQWISRMNTKDRKQEVIGHYRKQRCPFLEGTKDGKQVLTEIIYTLIRVMRKASDS